MKANLSSQPSKQQEIVNSFNNQILKLKIVLQIEKT